MKKERKQKLLDHKIYIKREKKTGTFITLCQLRVIESRIKSADLDLDPYKKSSYDEHSVQEYIYRYATDDSEIKLCRHCKEKRTKFISIEYGWHDFCSNTCSSKNKVENGVGIAGKSGWKHTEESKKKMSDNHADFSGDKNPFKLKMQNDPLFREEMVSKKKEYWSSLEDIRRLEISEIFSKAQAKIRLENNNKLGSYGRGHKSGKYYSDKTGKSMYYRSSWELAVCEYLEHSERVKFYDIEPFMIEYLLESGEKRYTRIDFIVEYVDGSKAIIEVKPKAFLKKGNVPNKITGCRKYAEKNNMKFVLITKEELEDLSLVI